MNPAPTKNRMKLYNALIKRDQNKKISDLVLIEDGFSWGAFFFSVPWFLFHKMWRNSLVLILINILFFRLGDLEFFSKTDLFFIEAAFLILIAINANYWYDQHLRRQGYEEIDYVLAGNRSEARLKAVEILHHQNPQLNFADFNMIIDLRAKKKEPYFT